MEENKLLKEELEKLPNVRSVDTTKDGFFHLELEYGAVFEIDINSIMRYTRCPISQDELKKVIEAFGENYSNLYSGELWCTFHGEFCICLNDYNYYFNNSIKKIIERVKTYTPEVED